MGVDPVVDERHQPVLLDRVPQPQFGSDAAVEVLEDRETVAALRCSRETQEFARPNVPQEAFVGRSGRVMELVHDHDVEVIGSEELELSAAQRLDRREDVPPFLGLVATDEELTEVAGPQDVPEQKCKEFQGKRDQVLAAFAAIPGVNCPKPQGAWSS